MDAWEEDQHILRQVRIREDITQADLSVDLKILINATH